MHLHQCFLSKDWLKLDSSGDFQWQKCLGGSFEDAAYSIIQDLNGGIVLVGTSDSNDGDISGNHGSLCAPYYCNDVWLAKINNMGGILWQKCLGGSNGEDGRGCILTSDSGYIVCGDVVSVDGDVTGGGNHGNGDVWVVKLSASSVGINPPSSIIGFNAHYNSFSNSLSIKFYSYANQELQLQMLDITGRVLMQKSLFTKQDFNSEEISTEVLSTGVYFVRMLSMNETITTKLIVE